MRSHVELSFEFKIRLILLLFTAMIPALALMLDSAAKYRDLTATQTKQNVLMAAGRAIASEQDRALDNAHEFLVTISRVPQIHEMNRAACSKILAGLLEPRYADLVVTDRSGNRVCTALARDNSLASSVSRDHSRSIEARDFTVGTIRRHASKKTLLDVTYPLLDGPGMIHGAVSAVLDLSWMSRMTADTHLYPGATFTLIGSNGDVLLRYPNDQEWIGKTNHRRRLTAETSFLRKRNCRSRRSGRNSRLFGISRLKKLRRRRNNVCRRRFTGRHSLRENPGNSCSSVNRFWRSFGDYSWFHVVRHGYPGAAPDPRHYCSDEKNCRWRLTRSNNFSP
jgi:hypothetical protein